MDALAEHPALVLFPRQCYRVLFRAGDHEVRYINGPIITRLGKDDIPDFEPLAIFRSELSENGSPPGVMVGSPAVVSGSYGKGSVVISSPHPEQTAGMEALVERVVRWVARPTEP